MKLYIPYKIKFLFLHLFRKIIIEKNLSKIYKDRFGVDLNINNPTTFSEKLFARMILVNKRGNAAFTRLADKFLVRDYVKQKVGEQYLVPLLWFGTNPTQIPFSTLPDKCVIKTNHGSASNIIKNGVIDEEKVIANLKRWLKEDYFVFAYEYHYSNIPRKVLVEQFLDDGSGNGPLDYRFWCFNGEPVFIQVDNFKHDINPFYDQNWNQLEVSSRVNFNKVNIPKPDNLEEMINVAKKLSADFNFVRVDLYNIKGQIYFGEMTFTPGSGRFQFSPESINQKLGELWSFDGIINI